MKKGITVLMVAALLCAVFTGCGAASGKTADAGTDKAILVVSFGTSYNDSRNITIGGVESAIKENFPDYDVRRAFTAQIIIDKLKERDGIEIDNVEEALEKLAADGVETLIVQPTHLMSGFEYDDVMAEVENYRDQFDTVVVGQPLLSSDEDIAAVIETITARTTEYAGNGSAVVFMGHGTEHEANAIYATLQTKIAEAGYDDYFIGTVEAEPSIEDVATALTAGGYTAVVLEPLMVVAGDHANNDMAGDEEDSWKTILTEDGYEVTCILEGLGQFNEIQDIYVNHVQAAIDSIN